MAFRGRHVNRLISPLLVVLLAVPAAAQEEPVADRSSQMQGEAATNPGQSATGPRTSSLPPTPLRALPAIGFTDGFETVDPWDGRLPSSRNRVSGTSAGFQGPGLRVEIPEGSHFGADFHLDLSSRLGEDPEQLYFRYFLRFDEDWAPTSSGKLPGFSGVYGRTGLGGFPSLPTAPGWSARVAYYPSTDGASTVNLGYYVYHLGQQGRYGDSMHWSEAANLVPGEWYCLEGAVQLNALGLADGALQAWVDGTPALDLSGLEFRRSNENDIRIDSFWFNVYQGGPIPAAAPLGLTVDEVAVDTHRIGCGVGSGTTQSVDADLDGDGVDERLGWSDCRSAACFWSEATLPATTSLDLEGAAWFSLETHRLGLAAGDVDGDGRDDLVYRGRCAGSEACWRVHRFSDPASGLAEDWGDDAWFAESAKSQILGDWDGDGMADLAYQGICGSERLTCWRTHRSLGDRFAAPQAWGTSPEHTVQGVSADVNGDTLDDIVYTAACEEGLCRYAQHSTGFGFASPHLLGAVMASEIDDPLLFDFDGDQRADVISVRSTEERSMLDVRLSHPDGLADPVTVAEFEDPVVDVALRRPHHNGYLEALVATACQPDDQCVQRYLTRSTHLLTPEQYRQEISVWMDRNRVE